ncbi:MAG: hypothetical protein K8F91_00360 [Candidatus Obscuribacterales bacterium]|nr:hypothetical protein [Candidatus Obscuribacterales bacterium]
MPYAPINPAQLYGLDRLSPQDLAAWLQWMEASQRLSPEQAYAHWEQGLPSNLQYSAADSAAAAKKQEYLSNDVNNAVMAQRARSTGNGLGGSKNTFAAAREAEIQRVGNLDAQAVYDREKAVAIDKINQGRSDPGINQSNYFNSFSGALGPFGGLIQ